MNKSLILAAIALASLTTPALAQRDNSRLSRNQDKNLMRNLGGLLGAAAYDSARRGQSGEAILFGAGAAYAGKKYEDARRAERDESRWGRYDDRWDSRWDNRRDDRWDDRWGRDDDRWDDRRGNSGRGGGWGRPGDCDEGWGRQKSRNVRRGRGY